MYVVVAVVAFDVVGTGGGRTEPSLVNIAILLKYNFFYYWHKVATFFCCIIMSLYAAVQNINLLVHGEKIWCTIKKLRLAAWKDVP